MSSNPLAWVTRKKREWDEDRLVLKHAYNPGDQASCTVTYAYKDKKFMRWLVEALEKEDHDVWVDRQDSPPNAAWIAMVYKEIEANDVFIFVLSPDSINNEDVDWAIDHALKTAKKIVPVLYRDVTVADVRPEISTLPWIFFREEGDNWTLSMEKLREAMNENLRQTRYHTQILMNALRWEQDEFNHNYLLKRPDIKIADEWLSMCTLGALPRPAMIHISYINGSRNHAERMRKRDAIALLFVIMVVIAIIWPSWGVFFFAFLFSHVFIYYSSA